MYNIVDLKQNQQLRVYFIHKKSRYSGEIIMPPVMHNTNMGDKYRYKNVALHILIMHWKNIATIATKGSHDQMVCH